MEVPNMEPLQRYIKVYVVGIYNEGYTKANEMGIYQSSGTTLEEAQAEREYICEQHKTRITIDTVHHHAYEVGIYSKGRYND